MSQRKVSFEITCIGRRPSFAESPEARVAGWIVSPDPTVDHPMWRDAWAITTPIMPLSEVDAAMDWLEVGLRGVALPIASRIWIARREGDTAPKGGFEVGFRGDTWRAACPPCLIPARLAAAATALR